MTTDKIDPQQIVSAIDNRAADIETMDNNILMEIAGVSMALDKLREALNQVAFHVNDREFEKASHVGYQDLAHSFVYVQRALAGLQSAAHQKEALIIDIAMVVNTAYENVAPHVEKRMASSAKRDEK